MRAISFISSTRRFDVDYFREPFSLFSLFHYPVRHYFADSHHAAIRIAAFTDRPPPPEHDLIFDYLFATIIRHADSPLIAITY